MKITAELIDRFFNKQCTAEQAKHIAIYLKENPAELDKYLDKNEWDTAQLNEVMPEAVRDEVFENITTRQKKSAVIVLLKNSAVAVAIVGVIFTGYYYFSISNTKNSLDKPGLNKAMAFVKPEHKVISNTSKQIMKVVLPDSSVVNLSQGAVIKYDVPFQNNKRDIFLTGEALFDVAKDKTKPFTAYAGSLTTTALGTKFKITTGKIPGNISVKLFTGKVVIRPIHPGLKGWKNDIYLLPGQQMRYDENKMFVHVEKIEPGVTVMKPVIKINPPAIAVARDQLDFDGTALPDVIDELSKYYSVQIEFNKAEISTMHFTGSINKKDSLINVLQLIGQMNNLNIIKEDEKFIIQKTTLPDNPAAN